MPFGLTNVPAVLLCDFINRCVFVYLDDILIFSRSVSEHENHEFDVQTVSLLGYIIEQVNLRADPTKVKAVDVARTH